MQRWGAQSGRVAAPPEVVRISTARVRERPAAAEWRLTRPSSLWSPERGWKRYLPLPRAAAKNQVKPPFELTAAWRVKGAVGGALRDASPDSGGGVGALTLLTFALRAVDFYHLFLNRVGSFLIIAPVTILTSSVTQLGWWVIIAFAWISTAMNIHEWGGVEKSARRDETNVSLQLQFEEPCVLPYSNCQQPTNFAIYF